MMPFFALVVIESRLVRMLDGLKAEFGEVGWAELKPDDRLTLIKDKAILVSLPEAPNPQFWGLRNRLLPQNWGPGGLR